VTTTPDHILELRQVSKRYPGTLAVDGVDLEVRRAEVHALMGENGAGKSTLMKILAGSFDDYTGDILINSQPVRLHSPSLAKAQGVEMIYQELSLAGPLSVAENILIGRLPRRGPFIDKRAMECEARRCLAQVGLEEIDPWQPVDMLSQHEAQLVEIAKALGNDPAVLVMDEPTSALSRAEVKRLFAIIERLKQQGVTIIYISHHLAEVYALADRMTVMRDGRKIATFATKTVDPAGLVEMMIGQPASQATVTRQRMPGKKRLRVRNLARYGFFHDIRFHIRAGEILGIGGLAGAGRTELARVLCGIDPFDTGDVLLDGSLLTLRSMRRAMQQGMAYLTEERKGQGLALTLTAQTNMLCALHVKQGHLLGARKQRASFRVQAEQLQLSPAQPQRQAMQYSGGNQQKILLGKWLATEPEVLILDEPTRGVDVGAKQVIHEAIARLADAGKCVLLVSSDLPELVILSDRVMIMRKGRFTREIGKEQLSENTVLLAANADAEEPTHV
jgi:ABC-type sugar transport system ATPase subunit